MVLQYPHVLLQRQFVRQTDDDALRKLRPRVFLGALRLVPESEVARVLIRVLEDHRRTRPDDKSVAEWLARLTAQAANREAAE